MEELLRVDVDDRNGSVVIALTGELDFGSAARLRAAMLEGLGSAARRVVVDLAAVSFVDSMGLSVLVQGKRHIEGNGGEMVLENPAPRVRRVLELAGVAAYLLAPSADESQGIGSEPST